MKLKIVIIVCVVLIAALIFTPIIRNNILLKKYSEQLFSIPLPENTQPIWIDKAVGNLYGTGNHLDFWAIVEIKSELSEIELNDYYKSFEGTIKSADEISIIGLNSKYPDNKAVDHSNQIIEVIPKKQCDKASGSPYILIKSENTDSSVSEDLYIIQIKDTHYHSNFDLRTH